MRIAHVANFYGPRSGGLRTAMHQVAAGYRAHGHEPLLIVPGPADADEDTPWGRRLTLWAPELPGTGGYRVIADPGRVSRLLEQLAPDRLEVSDRLTLRGLGWWGRAIGVPSLMWSHEQLGGLLHRFVPPVVPRRRIADAMNRRSAEAYDAVVCTTAFAAGEFARLGVRNLVRIPLGVDLDTFSPDRHSRALRAELAAGADVVAVMCSRLSPEKEPGRAIAALRLLLEAGVSARLVVLGDGPLRADLEQRAAGLPVRFAGFVEDRNRLADLLASADVVVAPGPLETFGLAALEALASGTPVVVSASSALAELVVAGAGVAVADDAESFAAGIVEALSQCSRGAARRRAEDFPWSRTVERMLSLHAGLGGEARAA